MNTNMRLPRGRWRNGHALSTMDCVVTGCGWLARPSMAVSKEQISESDIIIIIPWPPLFHTPSCRACRTP